MEYPLILLFFTIGLFSGFSARTDKIYQTFPIISIFNIMIYEVYLLYLLNFNLFQNLPLEDMLRYLLLESTATILLTAIGFSIGLFLKIAKGGSYGR